MRPSGVVLLKCRVVVKRLAREVKDDLVSRTRIRTALRTVAGWDQTREDMQRHVSRIVLQEVAMLRTENCTVGPATYLEVLTILATAGADVFIKQLRDEMASSNTPFSVEANLTSLRGCVRSRRIKQNDTSLFDIIWDTIHPSHLDDPRFWAQRIYAYKRYPPTEECPKGVFEDVHCVAAGIRVQKDMESAEKVFSSALPKVRTERSVILEYLRKIAGEGDEVVLLQTAGGLGFEDTAALLVLRIQCAGVEGKIELSMKAIHEMVKANIPLSRSVYIAAAIAADRHYLLLCTEASASSAISCLEVLLATMLQNGAVVFYVYHALLDLYTKTNHTTKAAQLKERMESDRVPLPKRTLDHSLKLPVSKTVPVLR